MNLSSGHSECLWYQCSFVCSVIIFAFLNTGILHNIKKKLWKILNLNFIGYYSHNMYIKMH